MYYSRLTLFIIVKVHCAKALLQFQLLHAAGARAYVMKKCPERGGKRINRESFLATTFGVLYSSSVEAIIEYLPLVVPRAVFGLPKGCSQTSA